MANKAYKYRIYPTPEQENLIARTFGCCRKVWNLMLAEREAARASSDDDNAVKIPSPALYKAVYPYLGDVDSYALTSEWADLKQAYANFFRNIKEDRRVGGEGNPYGRPRFKSRKRPKQSYRTCMSHGNIRVGGGAIRLPKLGEVRARLHRTIPRRARIKSVTVSRNGAGRYFASVLVELPDAPVESAAVESSLGLDYSSPNFYVASDGAVADPPRPYRAAQERLALEQRRLSRMVKGSSNWRKQKARIGRIHQRIADVRRDWIEKESTRIAEAYDLVALETLDMDAQGQSLNFGKAVHDNGFGMFRRRLEAKMAERGKHVVYIDKWFPSSKLCRECGHVNAGLELGQSVWECPECGAVHDRDAYAAETIRLEGLRTFALDTA